MTTTQITFLNRAAEVYMDSIELASRPRIQFVGKTDSITPTTQSWASDADKIQFDTSLSLKFHTDFLILLLLHKINQFVKDTISRNGNAQHITDMRHYSFLQFLKIRADVNLASYLKEKHDVRSFKEYLRSFYQATRALRNSAYYLSKIEYSIGSLASIKNLFDTGHQVYYLPQLMDHITALISIDPCKKRLDYAHFSLDDMQLKLWGNLFHNATTLSEREYVDKVCEMTKGFLSVTELKETETNRKM